MHRFMIAVLVPKLFKFFVSFELDEATFAIAAKPSGFIFTDRAAPFVITSSNGHLAITSQDGWPGFGWR
jgi:hypothetical protein